jgi:hypothetical protein
LSLANLSNLVMWLGSGVCSYPKILDLAGKACKGQIL